MTVIVSDPLIGPATPVELSQFNSAWHYARQAPTGTGIQVGASGAFSNATGGGISATNGGVAYRSDFALPAEQWAQMTLGPQQSNLNAAMALIIRASATGSYMSLECRAFGNANLFVSTAGAAPVAPLALNSWTGLTFAQGDVIRLELQQVTGVWTLRMLHALAATPTSFAAIATPGAWSAAGNSWLTATSSGGYAGIGAFMGAATLSYVHAFSAGDFFAGPVAPTSAKGAFTIRTTSQT